MGLFGQSVNRHQWLRFAKLQPGPQYIPFMRFYQVDIRANENCFLPQLIVDCGVVSLGLTVAAVSPSPHVYVLFPIMYSKK